VLDSLDAVAQLSKVAERLNFHWLRSRRNSDHKDLVLIPFHPLMNVCKMNEVLFRDQGTFVSGFVVDGNRPSCAHRIFSPKSIDTPLQLRIESFCRPEGTRTIRPELDESAPHQRELWPTTVVHGGFPVSDWQVFDLKADQGGLDGQPPKRKHGCPISFSL
jgi:hypothetical protein